MGQKIQYVLTEIQTFTHIHKYTVQYFQTQQKYEIGIDVILARQNMQCIFRAFVLEVWEGSVYVKRWNIRL